MSAPDALKGAFSAKIGKVPVVAIGIPIVIVGGLVLRHVGQKNSAASADTSQPAFFAKDTPDTWAAIDPSTGIGHSPDGTISYLPTPDGIPNSDGTHDTPGTTPTIPDTPAPVPSPMPRPNGLDAHQAHILHTQHAAHAARQASSRATPNHALDAHQAHVAHETHAARKRK